MRVRPELTGKDRELEVVRQRSKNRKLEIKRLNAEVRALKAELKEARETVENLKTGSEICAKASELVRGDRKKVYGAARPNFENTGVLWDAYEQIRPPGPLTAQDVAIKMVLFKISRTVTGTGSVDNFVDMAGYAGLAGQCWVEDSEGVTSEAISEAIRQIAEETFSSKPRGSVVDEQEPF